MSILIKKHRNAINNQKSYALLIWFLEFYGKRSNYTDFITDGNDDFSCDIILDGTDRQGNKIFYVVQSKWNNLNNSKKETDKDEILKALSDFTTIMRGEKEKANKKLSQKLEQLDAHLKANGEVKFIFLSLSQYKGGADDHIKTFTNDDDKIKFEVIDINRIRGDYIERKYKKIEPSNPLEKYPNPAESPIKIKITQDNGNFIKIDKPFEAYMVLLSPKSIYDLFEQYGFALFYKNVRNPLLRSRFNKEIEKTALENPAYFWYYNNGITAITYLLPKIGKKAEVIELTGLQIINGAQTVYAIYNAYKNASPTKRIQMDTEALVTLRILKSGGKDFDLNVTRYTNSQNPVSDRDFCANDDIQIALQNASYETNVWYEKRRDEFRNIPDKIRKVPNYVFAKAYLAYQLQDPANVLEILARREKSSTDLIFTSYKDHEDGLYEKIFNKNPTFKDMLCAFYLYHIIEKSSLRYQEIQTDIYHLLALFNTAFTKYLKNKYDESIDVNNHIIRLYESGKKEIIIKTFKYLQQFITQQAQISQKKTNNSKRMTQSFFTFTNYEKIKEALEEVSIGPDEIEKIPIESHEIGKISLDDISATIEWQAVVDKWQTFGNESILKGLSNNENTNKD